LLVATPAVAQPRNPTAAEMRSGLSGGLPTDLDRGNTMGLNRPQPTAPAPRGTEGDAAGLAQQPLRPPQGRDRRDLPPETQTAQRAAVRLFLHFATGSAELSPQAQRVLLDLGNVMREDSFARDEFLVEGHTDTVGPLAYNQDLSERRARAAAEFLIARAGVNPARLHSVGRGETAPAVPTRDEMPEARNRRVEVVNTSR
jgi:outer membrane protein OmpA-like peptidoglycan-associated protein